MAEQHFSNVEGVPEEEFFRILERSKPYKTIEMLYRKALEEQWNDILMSGIVNTMFNKYKQFFVKPRGKKAKIRKDFQKKDEVSSQEELEEEAIATLQQDRFIVDEKAIGMGSFLLFLGGAVASNMKSVGSYYGSKKEMRGYLKGISNKAGQTIIDLISTPRPIKFRLSNKALRDKISGRVNKLIKGLDNTTKKTFTRELAKGIKLGETKTKLLKRMQSKGVQVAKMRAKRIIATETEAIAEFMRYETAKLNGVKNKTWETAGDERVCPTCAPLDGITKPMRENFKSVDFSGKYPPAHPLCFDKTTEVLTDNGWKLFKEVDKSELILSVDLETGNSEWVGIKHLVKYRFTGQLSYYKSKTMSLQVTQDHKQVVKFRKKQKGRKDAGKIKLISEKELPNHDFNFVGTIPRYKGRRKESILIAGRKFNAKNFIEFMGYYISEGNISKPKNGKWQIKITQEKHYDKMLECAKKLFKTIWAGEKAFYVPLDDTKLIKWFCKLGKSWEKYVPSEIKNLDKGYLRVFLDAFLLGDGSVKKGKFWKGYQFKDSKTYITSSPQLASDIGELILKLGNRPSYSYTEQGWVKFKNGTYKIKHNCWRISENINSYPLIDRMEKSFTEYDDFVYDVELNKLHTLFIRREGKVLLSGNCRCSVDYDIEGNMCDQYVKSSSVYDRIKSTYESFIKGKSDLYNPIPGDSSPCVNENAVWAGGESLVGKDKEVGIWHDRLKNRPLNVDDGFLRMGLAKARHELSEQGYVQLRLKLGMSGKINKIRTEAEALKIAGSGARTMFRGGSHNSWERFYEKDSFRVGTGGVDLYGSGVYVSKDITVSSIYGEYGEASVVKAKLKESTKLFKVSDNSDLYTKADKILKDQGYVGPLNNSVIQEALVKEGYAGVEVTAGPHIILVYDPESLVLFK